MKKIGMAVGAAIVLGIIAWAALRKPPSPSAAPATPSRIEAPRVALAEAKSQIDSGRVTVIDVRDADAYIAGHIPGSLQIPLARVEGEINYLPRGKPIITYCT